MERLWCLRGYRRPDGNLYEPHPAIFHIYFSFDGGFPDNSLYGAGFLEKYPEIHESNQEKSLVLFVNDEWVVANS
jgi:hypothetical protein